MLPHILFAVKLCALIATRSMCLQKMLSDFLDPRTEMYACVLQSGHVAGRHVHTFSMVDARKYGMAVTPNGRYMVVSYFTEHRLGVYSIEADAAFTPLYTFGGKGAGPKQFNFPTKMCIAPEGNLLVCDQDNDRVQELTGLSEAEPTHVRDIHVPKARAIAVHSDMLAVGTRASVLLLSYATGTLIRTIGSEGTGPGNIGGSTVGLCFTPDGHSILVAERENKRMSKFRLIDGAFEDFYCKGQISDYQKDVEVAPSGEVIVADYASHRICVFSADGCTLLRAWGTYGVADGQFNNPTALALAGNKLFVLDNSSPRVQVFE